MCPVSSWFVVAGNSLRKKELEVVFELYSGNYKFRGELLNDALWLVVSQPDGNEIAFRMAYVSAGSITINKVIKEERQVQLSIGKSSSNEGPR
jgi:hypothetical protein